MNSEEIEKMFQELKEYESMMGHFSRFEPKAVITSSPANRATVSRYNSAAKNEARRAVSEQKKIEPNRKKILKNKWKAVGTAAAVSAYLYTGIFVTAAAPAAGVAYFAVGTQSKHIVNGFKAGLKTWREDKKNSKITGTKMARFKHAVSVGTRAYGKSSAQGMRNMFKDAKNLIKYELTRPAREAQMKAVMDRTLADMKNNKR